MALFGRHHRRIPIELGLVERPHEFFGRLGNSRLLREDLVQGPGCLVQTPRPGWTHDVSATLMLRLLDAIDYLFAEARFFFVAAPAGGSADFCLIEAIELGVHVVKPHFDVGDALGQRREIGAATAC